MVASQRRITQTASHWGVYRVETDRNTDEILSTTGAPFDPHPSPLQAGVRVVGARSVGSKEAPSAPVAESVSAKPQHTTAHNPKVVGTTVTDFSTASQQAPSRAPKTAKEPTRQGESPVANANPATPSPAQVSAHANGANTPKHSAPGARHAKGPKHREH